MINEVKWFVLSDELAAELTERKWPTSVLNTLGYKREVCGLSVPSGPAVLFPNDHLGFGGDPLTHGKVDAFDWFVGVTQLSEDDHSWLVARLEEAPK